MLRNILILGGLLTSAAAYTYYADFQNAPPALQQEDPAGQNSIATMEAPSFSFQDMEGKIRTLTDFKGKAVILNFWASWCAPCVIEMPQMFNLAEKTKEDAVYLFISLDNSEEEISRFLTKNKFHDLSSNIHIGLDVDRKISNLFQTYKIPETYLITPDLKISDKIIGADLVWNDQDMIEKIKILSSNP